MMHAGNKLHYHFFILWMHAHPSNKRRFFFVIGYIVLSSFLELMGIGIVYPFLLVLSSPDALKNNDLIKVFDALSLQMPQDPILFMTVTFCVITVFAGILRIILLKNINQFAFETCADIGSNIYFRIISQSYSIHIEKNSSEIISAITRYTDILAYSLILPAITLISSAMMAAIILFAIIAINPIVAITPFISLGVIYFFIAFITKRKMRFNSKVLENETAASVKIIQESLGGIRDILLDGTQQTYSRAFDESNFALRRVQASISFIGSSPRFAIEAFGMIVIALLAYFALNGSDLGFSVVFSLLGVLAIAIQRLLPILQQGYLSIISIRGAEDVLKKILELLALPLPKSNSDSKKLQFLNSIHLNKVSFQYAEASSYILRNVSLKINKGDRIGIIGKTGSGKSTLVDIIMGLLKPTSGEMLIDNIQLSDENLRTWQKNIAHVPQAIYLSDTSILENIAFGVDRDQINYRQVYESAAQAKIADLIESWPNGYETLVGERGVKLSGGQRQRIGIARALYKRAEVIIFDEATSSLDNETEQEVMNAIGSLSVDLTIVMIAHRLSTLKFCTKIFNVEENGVRLMDETKVYK